METIHVRIYEEDKDKLKKLAKELNITIAEYLHNLIGNHVNTNDVNTDYVNTNHVNIEKLESLSKELGMSELQTLEFAVRMLVNGKI